MVFNGIEWDDSDLNSLNTEIHGANNQLAMIVGYCHRENDDDLVDLGIPYFQTNPYHLYDPSVSSIPLGRSTMLINPLYHWFLYNYHHD